MNTMGIVRFLVVALAIAFMMVMVVQVKLENEEQKSFGKEQVRKLSELTEESSELEALNKLLLEEKELLEERIQRLAKELSEQESKMNEEKDYLRREISSSLAEAEKLTQDLKGTTELLETITSEKEDALRQLEEAQKQLSEQVVSVPKRHVTCKPTSTQNRPIFIFVVGAEGTGHHLIASLVDTLPGVVALPRIVQRLFAEMWEPLVNDERRATKRQELVEYLTDAAESALTDPSQTHFIIQTQNFDMYSFPYDDPRNPLRRPDILDLISLVEPHFDLRILVTVRNPMDCIVSLIRRNWWNMEMCKKIPAVTRNVTLYTEKTPGECGLIPVQTRVVEDAITYINAHLQTVSQEYFRTVNYDSLLENPTAHSQSLASFLGFPIDEVERVVTTKIKPRKTDYTQTLTDIQKDTINSVFNPKRKQQWDFLMREDFNLLSTPAENLWEKEEICVN